MKKGLTMFKTIKLLAMYCAASVIAHGAEYNLLCDKPSAYFFLVPRNGVDAVGLPHVLSYAVQGPVEVYGLSNDQLNDFLPALGVLGSENTKSPEEFIFPVPKDELLAFDAGQAKKLLDYLRFRQLPAVKPYVVVKGDAFERAYRGLVSNQKDLVDDRLARVRCGDFGSVHSITTAKNIKNNFSEFMFNNTKLRVYFILIDECYVGLLFTGDTDMPAQRNDIKRADEECAGVTGLINGLKMREENILRALRCGDGPLPEVRADDVPASRLRLKGNKK
jgi:hypothetical protein